MNNTNDVTQTKAEIKDLLGKLRNRYAWLEELLPNIKGDPTLKETIEHLENAEKWLDEKQ
jgi:hypothetical protein